MKNKSFIILNTIVVLAGIGAMLAGVFLSQPVLIFVGIGGIFVFGVVLTAVVIIKGVRKGIRGGDGGEAYTAPPREENAGDGETGLPQDVFTSGGSTYGTDGSFIDDNAEIIAKGIRLSHEARKVGGWSVGEKIFSIIVIAIFLVCFILCVVFSMRHNIMAFLICFGFVFLSMFSFIIYAVMSQSSLMDKKLLKTGERVTGVVTGCFVASETSVNGWVKKVVYRIVLEVYGETKVAFAKTPYNVGAQLTVACIQGKRRAAIVDNNKF